MMIPRDGYYHIVSRTVLKSFLLDEVAKEKFMVILRKLSQVYFVRVVSFAIMSNHVHLIVRMLPEEDISDEDVKHRFHRYYNEGVVERFQRPFLEEEIDYYRTRFGDLSKFMQDLKQRFSRWYNKKMDNHGHIWGERFTSVLLEAGRALTACMVYVELNSLRAGIVERPEDYRWCSLAHYVTGGRAASWLDHETLHTKMEWRVALDTKGQATIGTKSVVKKYLELIYREGLIEREGKASLKDNTQEMALDDNFKSVGVLSFRRRIRFFSDGVFLGGKDFCETQFGVFRDYFSTKKERSGQPVMPRRAAVPGGLLDIYAIRRFT